MYDYITIERRFGSGGQEIATKLAKKLGYALYDHGILVETCKRMGVAYSYIVNMDETASAKSFFTPPGKAKDKKTLTLEEQVFQTETEIIREAAEKPGCIFVGRCASEILKDKNVLKVFITADTDYRINRATSVEKVEPDKAMDELKKNDKRREKFFTAHSGAKWESTEYFDLILNSGQLGLDTCADILELIAKK